MTDDIDLLGQDAEQDVESLPEGNALGSFSTTSSTSTASCPASTAGCATTYACLG
ncbi:thiocillin family RiPP [uncultured Actinomyces sp.]|uniref:thiocillin family RiPP n=1 Tax=uncultured Actinomyces sp. TaxID=249061 RepID=UPI0028893F4A|nr:thiocillin family RiPP [uncultured Actinomyces sp.]